MGRRGAIAAVITVTAIFFAIRLGVRLLAREASSHPPPEIGDPARGGPSALPSPADTKRDAQAKIMTLATEAREADVPKAAVAAYAANDALRADDCARAKEHLGRSGELIPKDHRAHGAYESARQSVDAYCASRQSR